MEVAHRYWSDEEIDILRAHLPYESAESVATRVGRSTHSVERKASEHGIKGRPKDSFYGEASWNWREGTTRGSYGKHWERKVRPARLRLDGFMCQDCSVEDATGRSLAVHHVRLRRNGGPDALWNLVTLCLRCHALRPEHKTRGTE